MVEAEDLADTMLGDQYRDITQVAANQEEVRRAAAEIDWDEDDSESEGAD